MSSPRICVIGAGDWCTRMHRPALQRLTQAGRLRVAGVCDLDAGRAESLAAAVGAEAGAFTDPAAMLDKCHPDGLALLVNPAVTPSLIELAIARGLPFLTEKPPATDAATHRRLIERVGPLVHLVAYNRRFAPYSTKARNWLAGQSIQSVTCLFSRYRRRDPDFTTTAVHAIDAVRFLAGSDYAELRIEVVRGTGRGDEKEGTGGQAASGTLSSEGETPLVRNFFLGGWMASGARVDILITPDTASGEEHYIIRSAGRTVRLVFPHASVIDVPGFVELHEGNKLIARLGPRNFNCDPADSPALLGIVAEHETFAAALATGEPGRPESSTSEPGRPRPRPGEPIASTLAATLQTQEIRDAVADLIGPTGRQVREVKFS